MGRNTYLFLVGALGLALGLVALPSRGAEELTPAPATPQNVVDSGAGVGAPRLSGATDEELHAQRLRAATLAWSRNPFAPPPRPVTVEPPADEPPVEAHPRQVTATADVPEPTPREPAYDAQPRPASAPSLSGVSERDGERWAIIDGQVVSLGAQLNSGHIVLRIDRRSATVVLGTDVLELQLGVKR